MPMKTLKSAPNPCGVGGVDGDLVEPVGQVKVADSASMAANMPTIWAIIAGQ